ncbi:MAG: hypothetical protein QM791_01060 [Ferruginibacter sp.]
MQTIEIRQNKKTVVPMLVFMILSLLGMNYYIFFHGMPGGYNTSKILYVLLNVPLLYSIYLSTRKFFKNEPVLIFSKSGIEINEKGKPVSLLWIQVTDWKIENDDGTHYLTINTTDAKKKINISWLDKRATEIEELMQEFTKKPKPQF